VEGNQSFTGSNPALGLCKRSFDEFSMAETWLRIIVAPDCFASLAMTGSGRHCEERSDEDITESMPRSIKV
jgi:hypothetical protein